jgi:hypothetical protein
MAVGLAVRRGLAHAVRSSWTRVPVWPPPAVPPPHGRVLASLASAAANIRRPVPHAAVAAGLWGGP